MKMIKLITLLIASIGLIFGLAAPANAAPLLSGGMKITANGENFCSLAAVGSDDQGRKVALSAGHCMNGRGLGVDLYKCLDQTVGTGCGLGEFIGRTATASSGFNFTTLNQDNVELDYLVVELVPDAVLSKTTPRGLVIDGVGPNPAPFSGIACKDGSRTGKTCGVVLSNMGNLVGSWQYVNKGDSGSPLTFNNKIVGITSHIDALKPWAPFNFAGMDGIMADLNAQTGAVGHGFVTAP